MTSTAEDIAELRALEQKLLELAGKLRRVRHITDAQQVETAAFHIGQAARELERQMALPYEGRVGVR